MRILFTGGGTGGHFFPILAVIRELKKRAEEEQILDLELYYMGPGDFGRELLIEEGVMVLRVWSGKWRRYGSLQNIPDLFKILAGTLQALWNVFLIMPDAVFSKGGYGALPAVIAAFVFRLPLVIHESDAVPGRVNRFAARFAARIGIAFAGAAAFFPNEKTALIGVPIRSRILGGDLNEAREIVGIFSTFPTIGIIGASQGAQKLNEAVLGVLKELTDAYEVLHQTGPKNYDEVAGEARVILEFGHKERYHAFGFLDESRLRAFYRACDLVVSRASASSVYEIAAWGKPSILVPLSHAAQDHQRKNAYEYAAGKGAVVIEEVNLSPHVLLSDIKKLMADPERRARMGEAAQRFGRIDAAEVIAKEILKLGVHVQTS